MKIYFVAPAFKLKETPAEVHRYAYWSLLGAPGIFSIELVILFL